MKYLSIKKRIHWRETFKNEVVGVKQSEVNKFTVIFVLIGFQQVIVFNYFCTNLTLVRYQK